MTSKRKNSKSAQRTRRFSNWHLGVIMLAALSLQIVFWSHTYTIKPQLGVVPPVPSYKEAKAMALGDDQFYFRWQALGMQMMGDTWGRTTPLKDYNYVLIRDWLMFLDQFDPKSNMLPSSAAYYYSKSQHPQDVRYVLDYLEARSFKDPEYNWWWLSQSIYLANSVLKDKERAIKLANVMRKVKADIPLWARQMEAFLREDLGEKEEAKDIICDVIRTAKDIPEKEMDFMYEFLKDRLKIWEGKKEEIAAYCASKM